VVWRLVGGTVEVLLVHRPRYDDWSFPKGKRDPGETDEACAVREVLEETGLAPALGPELVSTAYVDHRGRSKLVRYWAMTVAEDAGFVPNDEVDELAWFTPSAAAARLTYERDRAVLAAFTGALRPDD
jgi:8-oxo-dGTP diphosphatase